MRLSLLQCQEVSGSDDTDEDDEDDEDEDDTNDDEDGNEDDADEDGSEDDDEDDGTASSAPSPEQNNCEISADKPAGPVTRQRRPSLTSSMRMDTYSLVAEPPKVAIPPWSLQDRIPRFVFEPSCLERMIRNLPLIITVLFLVTFVLPHLLLDLDASRSQCNWLLVLFIALQLLGNIAKSVPDVVSTPTELGSRTNANTFLMMVLYPCIGVWLLQRHCVPGLETLWSHGWGPIFPLLMWGLSAFLLLRDAYSSETVDRSVVVSSVDGKAVTGLFRYLPSRVERTWTEVGRFMTLSLWDVLPPQERPPGWGGRFFFQMLGPFVLLFLFIGCRFMLYSGKQVALLMQARPTVVRVHMSDEGIKTAFMVWCASTVYCIVLRALLPSNLFLALAVEDLETKRWLKPTWARSMVESKRSRLLWATRGLTQAFVPYYLMVTQQESVDSYWLWLGELSVFVSFFMEGLGALFFALHEAERGCELHLPFKKLMELSFWCAFNSFIFPLGSLVNLIFYFVNGEYKRDCVMREFWGPLIDHHGNWRWDFSKWLPAFRHHEPSEEEIERNVEEWISTWKRKRQDAGKDTEAISQIGPLPEGKRQTRHLPMVFHGTVFPSKNSWMRMRNEASDHIVLMPWEVMYAAEKFLQWYPTYSEELQRLLRQPYDFKTQRTVWVFGYGSLMSPNSPPAGLTEVQKKQLVPYWLKKEAGFNRVWNYRHGTCGINALGLMSGPGCGMDICGMVYPMDYEKASDLFSVREDGYELLLLHESFFEPMHPDYALPSGVGYVWVCGQPTARCKHPEVACSDLHCKRHWPSPDSPILQSYVDEVLMGALRFKTNATGRADGMNFAAAIIRSTLGWDRPWINDRMLPGRPWKFCPQFEIIDGLLSTCPTSAEAFLRRRRPEFVEAAIQRNVLKQEALRFKPWALHTLQGGNSAGICPECTK